MRRLLLPLALAAAAALPASAGAASWVAQDTLSAPHTFQGPISLASAGDGTLIAAWPWQDGTGVTASGGAAFAVRTSGSGGFGAQNPAPAGLVAVAPFGRIGIQPLALALRPAPGRAGPGGALRQRIEVAFGSLSRFGAVRTLATAPVLGRPQLAVAGTRALISWIEVTRTSTGAIRRVVRAIERRDGRFGAPFTLSGVGRADTLTAAIGARGDEAVAFVRDGDLLARVRRPGHGWGSLQRLARADGATRWQLVSGIDARGQVRVVWRRHQLSRSGVPGRTALESAAMLVARTTFTAAQTLTPDGASAPALTATGSGWAVADVETTASGLRPALHRTRGGSAFAAVQYAAPAQDGARGAAVASSSVGGLTVAWVQPVAGQDGDGVALAASLLPAVGAPDPPFGPVEQVSPPEAVHEVHLGVGGAGQPVAVWTARPTGTGPSIPLAQLQTFVRSAARVGT